jgi:diaminopimelate decarboxylase/aspartate kinase
LQDGHCFFSLVISFLSFSFSPPQKRGKENRLRSIRLFSERKKMLTIPTGEKREKLLQIAQAGTPVYAYDIAQVQASAAELRQCLGPSGVARLFYAMKANPHPAVLRAVTEAGYGIECVSAAEVEQALRVVSDDDRVLFTPNFAPRAEYERVAALAPRAHITVDNAYVFDHWLGDGGASFLRSGREVLVRLDPGQGEGHHSHVVTAGTAAKFGIDPTDLPRCVAAATAHGVRIVGVHAHVGSGILHPEPWARTLRFLLGVARSIPTVRFLNIGGGYGVVQNPAEQTPLDVAAVGRLLAAEVDQELWRSRGGLEVWTEPGRFLVAQAGTLLARVTQTKRKGAASRFVGVDAGMNSLIRPALYGAYHHVVNLSRSAEPHDVECAVVGPICESGDVLNSHVLLPASTAEDDVLLIATAGAYGHAMSSSYNLRTPAREETY